MKFSPRHATSLVLILLITTFGICQAKESLTREAFTNNGWGYMEQKFITEINDSNHKNIQKILKYCVWLSSLGLIKHSFSMDDCIMYPTKEQVSAHIDRGVPYLPVWFTDPRVLYMISFGFGVVACKTAAWMKKQIKHYVAFIVLEEFLNQWQENKPYTPKELHAKFEKLKEKKEKYEARDNNKWFIRASHKVVKEIRRKCLFA